MWNNYDSSKIIKVNPPEKKDVWIIRILICCGLVSMLIFIIWFLNPEHIGYAPLFWLLMFALSFKFFKMLQEWYHYWNPSVPEIPEWKTKWTVDILTTACPGEPHDMIIRTITAMKNISYPHTNYLCDEGNDPVLKKVCEELGVVHVTRTEKKDAKAGNINNALKQASGEICVILDPDHVPIPEFLDRVLPYFENPNVGYVQCVQAYGNQSASFIARAAAEQSYHFYGPMMMSMNSYGTVQAIGANCTFRRKALDSIGGHAPGLAEDMHTAMQLQAKGWKNVYVPEILSRGLVPATLSAYYKQQLKWSRGCFELLFRTYPGLFRKFTWRQKIHHFTMPLYFLFGLVNLIDIAVPLFALGFAEVPWEFDLNDFAIYFLLLCGVSMIVRLYAQRWLLEKHERGFHFAGGILRTATWWILLVGFVYAIFNIKVPYIPTPKEDEHENYWKLSIPNILMVILCGIIIYYGLSIDWTPYSMAMAGFVVINAGILAYVAFIGQQKLLYTIEKKIMQFPFAIWLRKKLNPVFERIHNAVYALFQKGFIALLLSFSLLVLGYGIVENKNPDSGYELKETGGFYLGINFANEKINPNEIVKAENKIKNSFGIVSFKSAFGKNFPEKIIKEIGRRGSIPMLNWEFFSNGKIYIAMPDESYLKNCAAFLRSYADPVFINLFPGFVRSNEEKENVKEFISTWQNIYLFFCKEGVSNITWVWSPQYFPSASNYYPGDFFVDWINISGEKIENISSFFDFYYSLGADKFHKPVMVSDLDNETSIELLSEIRKNKIGIYSVIFPNTDFDADQLENISEESLLEKKPFAKNNLQLLKANKNSYVSSFVKGAQGKYELMVNGQPYYIKGVAYNTGHDWRDGNVPLARRQLEKDFSLIKEMGANTIRRYGSSFYDNNILNLAEENDLKILYGFFFDIDVDYYKDTLKVQQYVMEVEKKVMAYKNYPAILGWSLGNETWGLLKKKFSKPYLTIVRQQYVKMVEYLAQRIHKIDPNHPVFTCMEDGGLQLSGELAAFHDGAPSVDVIGINSYYRENISRLDSVFTKFNPSRPYIVSEFGPLGYWDNYYNKLPYGILLEQSEKEKSFWYKEQWVNKILANKGKNVGGFAYCWKDRMEATDTWFGITDYKGRIKPSYYSLKEVWSSYNMNRKLDPLPQFTIVPPPLIIPGKKFVFTALSKGKKKGKLKYEWCLLKDDYLKEIHSIEYSSSDSSVFVKIPYDNSKYRLYLYVSDKNGNVSTASYPIKVN